MVRASLHLEYTEDCEVPVHQDLLILLMRLALFVRAVCNSTVVMNPSDLTKGVSPGGRTYAAVGFNPMKSEMLEANGGVKRDVTPEGTPKDVVEDGA